MVAWLIPILVSIALSVVSYLLAPKPKQAKPEAAKEADNPTAEAGKEIPVLFGQMTIKAPNVLDYTDKYIYTYKVKV